MRHFILITLYILGGNVVAQEGLRPLRANLSLHYRGQNFIHHFETASIAARQQSIPIQLPFKEDFYYSPQSTRPSPVLWVDTGALGNSVYVNSGFAIAPPSIGVATFDGLNSNGYPYDPLLANLNISRPADALTSRPINLYVAGSKTLQPSDSVSLSFFYQARGYGDNPEASDTLMVDLYDATNNVWNNKVWFQKGYGNPNVIDTTFRRAYIRITDPKYFHQNFQFRIRNRATTAGDFDHWHVDYIFLDKQQDAGNVVYNDLTFGYVPSSLLYQYSAMPFNQYRGNELTDHYEVRIKNNKDIAIGMEYYHRILDSAGSELYFHPGGPANLGGFADTGYSHVPKHSNINLSTTLTLPAMTDSTEFRIQHVLFRDKNSGNDFIRENDTLWQVQSFRNYYAFDDGGAEAGYFVNKASAKIAVKVTLNERDSLRALRIYFDPVSPVGPASEAGFRILVWPSQGSGPSAIPIHSFTEVRKQSYIKTGEREFPEYKIDPVVLDAGTYYIGIQQQAATVTIGFDRNYDAHRNLYYDSGSGWFQSQLRGAIMMRPVFGKKIVPVSVNEAGIIDDLLSVFPNPANNVIHIVSGTGTPFTFTFINALGAIAGSGNGTDRAHFDSSSLPQGIYYLLLKCEGGITATRKVIITR